MSKIRFFWLESSGGSFFSVQLNRKADEKPKVGRGGGGMFLNLFELTVENLPNE